MKQPEKVAVLGGLGFIGSHLCRALVARGFAVRIIDRADCPGDRVSDIADRVEVRPGNLADTDDMIAAVSDADTLIHLVHSTVPQGSMADPAADIIDNVVATARLAARLNATTIRRMIHISSGGAVYGVNTSARIRETEPTHPISSYGITKLANEKYMEMYAASYGIRCLIARPANIYGPHQQLHKGQGIIGTIIHRSFTGLPIEIWGSGDVVRDYLYIDDMIAGILALLSYEGPHRIFNIGCGRGHSIAEIVEMIGRQLGGLPEIVRLPSRGFDVPSNVLDPTLLEQETDWLAGVPLDHGIARVIASFRAGAA